MYVWFLKKIYLLIWERHTHTHWFVVPLIYAFIGCFLYVPWPGIEPTMLVYQDNAPPELPGQGWFFFAQYYVGSIHVLACSCGSFNFTYFVNKTQLTYYIINEHLGCFLVRAFTTNAASNIYVSVHVCTHLLGVYLGVKL